MESEPPCKKTKAPPPTPEEIERRREARKHEVVPPGLSRREWKKQQKLQRWEETKDQYRQDMKLKKKQQRQRKRERLRSDEEYRNSIMKKPKHQIATNVKIAIDCEFDDLMNQKEIVSMANQIRSCYSSMRHCQYELPIQVMSFNKRLKQRYDTCNPEYTSWKGIQFQSEHLADLITPENKHQFVYLTADTDNDIQELSPNHTYIIGGIVDKNRHKNLCFNKAKSMGLAMARLPIGQYIKINSRDVLVTSHVYEIICRWFECKDWRQAFNKVLPPRKVVQGTESGQDDTSNDGEYDVGIEDKENECEDGKQDAVCETPRVVAEADNENENNNVADVKKE